MEATQEQQKEIIAPKKKSLISQILPRSRAGLAPMQSTPQTLLSKEQRMLNAMFNSKNQFWGTGDVVRINRTLTSGQGLINTGDGDSTRRLFLP